MIWLNMNEWLDLGIWMSDLIHEWKVIRNEWMNCALKWMNHGCEWEIFEPWMNDLMKGMNINVNKIMEANDLMKGNVVIWVHS